MVKTGNLVDEIKLIKKNYESATQESIMKDAIWFFTARHGEGHVVSSKIISELLEASNHCSICGDPYLFYIDNPNPEDKSDIFIAISGCRVRYYTALDSFTIVNRNFRQRGIARQIMVKKIETLFNNSDASFFEVEVHKENSASRRLVASLGFEEMVERETGMIKYGLGRTRANQNPLFRLNI